MLINTPLPPQISAFLELNRWTQLMALYSIFQSCINLASADFMVDSTGTEVGLDLVKHSF